MEKPLPKATAALSHLGWQIDLLDSELVALIAKRQCCVEQVIAIKPAENLPARVPERTEEVLAAPDMPSHPGFPQKR
jgi:isochorismate pyruvate lyase